LTEFTPPPAEVEKGCAAPLPPIARRGVDLFNKQKFFEAHEALETAWRDETGPVRELYRAVLQAGVACYHIQRGNYSGAMKMIAHMRDWLAPFPPVCQGIHLAELAADMQKVETAMRVLGPQHIKELNPACFPKVKLDR
jgi:hypothetical protein